MRILLPSHSTFGHSIYACLSVRSSRSTEQNSISPDIPVANTSSSPLSKNVPPHSEQRSTVISGSSILCITDLHLGHVSRSIFIISNDCLTMIRLTRVNRSLVGHRTMYLWPITSVYFLCIHIKSTLAAQQRKPILCPCQSTPFSLPSSLSPQLFLPITGRAGVGPMTTGAPQAANLDIECITMHFWTDSYQIMFCHVAR